MSFYQEQEFHKGFDFSLWRRLIGYLKSARKYLAWVVGSMVLSAGIDVVFPILNGYVIDHFVVPGSTAGMPGFIAIYAGLMLLQAGNMYFHMVQAGKAEILMSSTVRTMAFDKLQRLSYNYFDHMPVGNIMARLTSDATRLGESVAWGLVDLVWGLLFMIFTMVSMLIIHFWLGLAVISVIPVLLLISSYFQRRILAGQRKVRRTNSMITSAFNEGILGAKTTKTLVREEANLGEFQQLTHRMYGASVKVAGLSALYMPLALLLGSVGTAIALHFGGTGVIAGTLTYGDLVVFMNYTTLFFEPVRELARVLADLQSSQAAAERVVSLIESEPQITDNEAIEKVYGDTFHPKRENWPKIHGEVTFEHVDFHYESGEEVLRNFSLEVPAGTSVALVGETGSGKSTIVNLVCRFYEPTKGRILIDGVDYRERSQLWLQSHLGYVLQSPHLFSGTVRDNIRYGRLDASDEEIERVARLVNAHPFISRLEYGYDTEVGEGGSRLSTGEKQLISFARAILADPPIFVLDEATSSIDTETEMAIQHAIQEVLRGRTSFIVAHRLSTIQNADIILVIENGTIVEQGTHEALLEKKGHYYALYTQQFQLEAEKEILG